MPMKNLPVKVTSDTMRQLDLPQLIEVDDYHEFNYLQTLLRSIGFDDVTVTEVGYWEGKYVGLIGTRHHESLANDLTETFYDMDY